MNWKDMFPGFLREWLQWAEDGTPYHHVLEPNQGLCDNFYCWVKWHRDIEGEYVARQSVYDFMGDLFEADGLAKKYPFNTDMYQFQAELDEDGCGGNDDRVRWVKAYLKKLEKNHA